MNLKVAHKVIIGFGVIILLLIFTSMSSIGILADIEEATVKVDELAIPTQQQSNAMQISLLKQGKLSSQIPNTTTLNQLEQIESSYQKIGQQLSTQKSSLIALLKQQKLDKQVSAISKTYESFNNGFELMLSYKRNVIKSTAQLSEYQATLNYSLDEAGLFLGDLSYLDDPDNQATVDRIAGSAGQIEGYLIGVTNSSQGVAMIKDLIELEDNQAVIQSSISNINQMVSYLVREGEEYNTDGVIESFVEEYNKASAILMSEQGFFSAKRSQLEYQEALLESTSETESSVNQLVSLIDKLLLQVDDNLQALQTGVLEDVNQGQLTTMVIMVVMIVAGSGIAFATVRAMILPLSRINNVLGYIAQGDLSRHLHVTSQDEYGVLSTNVNSVLDHLKTLIANIGDNSTSLNAAAAQSTHEIKAVAQSLTQQQSTVEKMTTVTDELNRNADDVLSKSTHAEEQMTQALSQSGELEQRANTTAARISALTSMLDDTAGLISVLNREATNIGGILETIQSIADQTNLLALNAAIEAARAGEAGRGFAVVADEVRMLASRTQESTAEINAMIESLQNQTNKVVDEIGNGKAEANQCQQQTENLLEFLVIINQAIEQMHQMSSEISASATQQNLLSNEINSGILEVSQISQASSEKSVSTLEYSEEVSILADKLKYSVDEFKVN
ncbi:methyl-accepting chemotaxis protein [Thalassotalea atypica]|uniref:methyl-accepting chemotaxis protein n=1 Tax=Thalassotalea atypica TaxID=2054316 RepID=UPI0025738B88|nr:methyl-accepting chemotaxis protein [Thalassotalea atypica]